MTLEAFGTVDPRLKVGFSSLCVSGVVSYGVCLAAAG